MSKNGKALFSNCITCGQFHSPMDKGCSWAIKIPSDYWNGPDGEVSQCKRCTERVGPIGSMGGNESTHGVN